MALPLADRILSLLVPPLCVSCREPELSGDAVCPRCRDSLAPRPRASLDRGIFFAGAWAPFEYDEAARRIVMALKARSATRAAGFMASAIEARAPVGLLDGVIVPVPGHPDGNRRRGFDHARLIAGQLARLAGTPVAEALRRTEAPPQVGLARVERRANAGRSVALRDGGLQVDRVVLVDDVYTTGATLDACAEALLAGGAAEVVAACFARTSRDREDPWHQGEGGLVASGQRFSLVQAPPHPRPGPLSMGEAVHAIEFQEVSR